MNKHITAATLIILLSGIIKAWQANTPITRVIIGGYVLMLVLAILDMLGGKMSQLASAIAMLAVVYVLINDFPWQTLIGTLAGKQAKNPGDGAPAAGGGIAV